jgi:hypothetical protein
LAAAAGYSADEAEITYLDVRREMENAGPGTRLCMHRNLGAILKGVESDVMLDRHDAVGAYRIVPPRTKGPARWWFAQQTEVVVNDDGAGQNMFIDFDSGQLLTPPKTVDRRDERSVRPWMKQARADALAETAPDVGGLIGFDMVALGVDDHYWDFEADEVVGRLAIGNFAFPVLMRAENSLPATYLIKTREYGYGVLQILAFTRDPEGVRIRYKMVQKGTPERVDVLTDKPPVVLDLDSGKVMGIDKDWPDEYDVGWDNDAGGQLVHKARWPC